MFSETPGAQMQDMGYNVTFVRSNAGCEHVEVWVRCVELHVWCNITVAPVLFFRATLRKDWRWRSLCCLASWPARRSTWTSWRPCYWWDTRTQRMNKCHLLRVNQLIQQLLSEPTLSRVSCLTAASGWCSYSYSHNSFLVTEHTSLC